MNRRIPNTKTARPKKPGVAKATKAKTRTATRSAAKSGPVTMHDPIESLALCKVYDEEGDLVALYNFITPVGKGQDIPEDVLRQVVTDACAREKIHAPETPAEWDAWEEDRRVWIHDLRPLAKVPRYGMANAATPSSEPNRLATLDRSQRALVLFALRYTAIARKQRALILPTEQDRRLLVSLLEGMRPVDQDIDPKEFRELFNRLYPDETPSGTVALSPEPDLHSALAALCDTVANDRGLTLSPTGRDQMVTELEIAIDNALDDHTEPR